MRNNMYVYILVQKYGLLWRKLNMNVNLSLEELLKDDEKKITIEDVLELELDLAQMLHEDAESIDRVVSTGTYILALESCKELLTQGNFSVEDFEQYKPLFEESSVSYAMENLDQHIGDSSFVSLALEVANERQKKLQENQKKKIESEIEKTKEIQKKWTDIINFNKREAIKVFKTLNDITSIDTEEAKHIKIKRLNVPKDILPVTEYTNRIRKLIATIKNTSDFKHEEFEAYTENVRRAFATIEQPIFNKPARITDNAFVGWISKIFTRTPGTAPGIAFHIVLHKFLMPKINKEINYVFKIPLDQYFEGDILKSARVKIRHVVDIYDQPRWFHGALAELIMNLTTIAKNIFTGWSTNKLTYVAIVNYSFSLMMTVRWTYSAAIGYYFKSARFDMNAAKRVISLRQD